MQDTRHLGWYPNMRVKIKEKKEDYYEIRCPKCNEELFGAKGKIKTIARIGLNDDEFEIEQIRGI